MEQRMIMGNSPAGGENNPQYVHGSGGSLNESVDGTVSGLAAHIADQGAFVGNQIMSATGTYSPAPPLSQHAPFKLINGGQTHAPVFGNFQGSIFDTPPSLHNSPQYQSLFSSPIMMPTPSPQRTTMCSLCGLECIRDATTIVFNNCQHRYCSNCISMTSSPDGAVCPVCIASAALDQSPLMLQQIMNQGSGKVADLGILLSSRDQNASDGPMAGSGTPIAVSNVELRGIWEDRKAPISAPVMNIDSISSPVFSPISPARSKLEICSACQDGHTASHYCQQCSELLCPDCVGAHQRVRITREHTVTPLDHVMAPNKNTNSVERSRETRSDSSNSVSSSSSPGHQHGVSMTATCMAHYQPALARCDNCTRAGPLCAKCMTDHPRHRLLPYGDLKSSVLSLVGEVRREEKNLEETISTIQHMGERIDASVQSTANDLRSEIHKHISALEERKRELLQRVDMIRQTKQATLKSQTDTLVLRRQQMVQVLKSYDKPYDDADVTRLIAAFEQLVQLCALPPVPLEPNEIDLIRFSVPDTNLIAKIRGLGELESGPSAVTSKIVGDSYRRAILDRQCTINVQLNDACGEPICVSGYTQFVVASMMAPDGSPVELNVSEREVGVVALNYYPIQDGIHLLTVMIHGLSICGCPAKIEVRRGRNYQDIAQRGEVFHFGKEGSGDGELCRPWGICCDVKGRLIVADRSNNRIQLFDKDGNYLMKFGESGTRAGQFDRPAGVCVNTKNSIIVADKDNHRVQVFDEMGNFVLKFGERGRPVGMFNYPWGVATNSQNHIAVSDTRNHRVQIFTAMGQFLRKCGFDTAYFYKHLDSPRGVCYLPDGQLLITDFNNHRVVLMGPRAGPDMKCYGSEGDQEGMFLRPQGIKTDLEGHILVCDSRNNRIQVFSADDMRCVATFGGAKVSLAPPSQASPASIAPPLPLPVLGRVGVSANPVFGDFSTPPPFHSTLTPVPPVALSTPLTAAKQEGATDVIEPALLDRPTDLCVGPDGRIYVVDFGNNCIRVF